MFKRMLCLLIVLALLPVLPAMAEESNADTLTLEELRQWVNDYKIRALATQPLNDPAAAESLTEDGYEFVYEFATLYMDSAEMTADSEVQALVITSNEEADVRGVRVDDSAEDVLNAYYTENPDLVGNSSQALLYAVDLMPAGVYIGTVHRDGQRIQLLEYSVYEQLQTGDDGYTDAGILYTLVNGNVSVIRAYGLHARVQKADVDAELESAWRLSAETSYSRVETSLVGSELEVFNSEDMIFSGIDFSTLTPKDAIAAFGQPLEDVRLDDEDGYMRVMQFENCEVTFLCDSAEQNVRVKNLTIDTDRMEGPRSVRVGDTLASVLNRFRNGEGEYDGTDEVLYGNEESGEFGVAKYGEDASVVLRYGALSEEGTPVLLYLYLENYELSEIILMINE